MTSKNVLPKLVVVTLSSMLFAVGCRSGPTLTVAEVDKEISQEIHPGSEATEVLKFLNTKRFGNFRFDHTGFNTNSEMISTVQRYTSDQKAKRLSGAMKGLIDAQIANTSPHRFTTSAIVARFYFNANHQLIDYEIKEMVGK